MNERTLSEKRNLIRYIHLKVTVKPYQGVQGQLSCREVSILRMHHTLYVHNNWGGNSPKKGKAEVMSLVADPRLTIGCLIILKVRLYRSGNQKLYRGSESGSGAVVSQGTSPEKRHFPYLLRIREKIHASADFRMRGYFLSIIILSVPPRQMIMNSWSVSPRAFSTQWNTDAGTGSFSSVSEK